MENYKSLPFAAYDLAVYLPGGAVVVFLVKWVIDTYFAKDGIIPQFSFPPDSVGQILKGVVWVSVSYLVGHLCSFISSYLIEKFIHNSLGFPSFVWMDIEEEFEKNSTPPSNDAIKSIISRNIRSYPIDSFASLFVLFFQLPVLPVYYIMLKLKIHGFYIPKIPFGLRAKVDDSLKLLIGITEVSRLSRWDKFVEHYVSNNCPLAYARMYNYLIVYGALRFLALICLGFVWWHFLFVLNNYGNCDFGFDIKYFILYWIIMAVYVVCVMAFAKFNRRYFEEGLLAFVLIKRDVV